MRACRKTRSSLGDSKITINPKYIWVFAGLNWRSYRSCGSSLPGWWIYGQPANKTRRGKKRSTCQSSLPQAMRRVDLLSSYRKVRRSPHAYLVPHDYRCFHTCSSRPERFFSPAALGEESMGRLTIPLPLDCNRVSPRPYELDKIGFRCACGTSGLRSEVI